MTYLGEAEVVAAVEKSGFSRTAARPPIGGFTFVEMNAQGYPEYTHDSSCIHSVRLPGGSFNTGNPAGESGHNGEEEPRPCREPEPVSHRPVRGD